MFKSSFIYLKIHIWPVPPRTGWRLYWKATRQIPCPTLLSSHSSFDSFSSPSDLSTALEFCSVQKNKFYYVWKYQRKVHVKVPAKRATENNGFHLSGPWPNFFDSDQRYDQWDKLTFFGAIHRSFRLFTDDEWEKCEHCATQYLPPWKRALWAVIFLHDCPP